MEARREDIGAIWKKKGKSGVEYWTILNKEGDRQETDLRAHTNPTRMANIMKATQDLSQKLASLCPQCSAPGFWITQKIKGLPCSECATPTHLPIADVWSCTKCNFKRETKLQIKTADPSRCPNCNP